MFTVLNRLRGTWGWMAKVTGLIIGFMFYAYSGDIYTSIGLTVAYVAGESMGWGKWIGGIHAGNYYATKDQILDREGRSNGIHYIISLFIKETQNYYAFCKAALALRGVYWFGLTMLPLVVGGYIPFTDYFILTLLLGYGFTASVKLGIWSTKKFNFTTKYFSMDDFWTHGEVWYGLFQDLAAIIVVYTILT